MEDPDPEEKDRIMRRLGADLTAIACILAATGTSWGLTLALMHRDLGEAESVCVVEATRAGPEIVVTSAREGVVVLSAPQVQRRMVEDCETTRTSSVTVHLEEVKVEVEEARADPPGRVP